MLEELVLLLVLMTGKPVAINVVQESPPIVHVELSGELIVATRKDGEWILNKDGKELKLTCDEDKPKDA